MFIQNILHFLKNNKTLSLYMVFIALFFLLGVDGVFAEDKTDPKSADYLNGIIALVTSSIGMLSNIVGVFLNPGWTNGTGLGLQVQLKDLWIMVSNIVYVIFAFLLIIIAFMNIIGRGDQWELKQALPKFVIGVLIVPFSWLFVQFVIAISSFLSVSVLMLPYDVLSNSPKSGWSEITDKEVCTTYIVISKQKTTNDKEVNKNQCGGETKIGELLTSNGIYGLLNIYTYGIFSIDDLSKINGEQVSTFSSLFKISMNLLLVLLLAIVYFILMVSLFLALFVRGVWLWMYMVFSPVFGLLFFFGKSKENGFMDGKFSISEFISLAMVPVYVSAALAFGLVFIFVAGTSFSEKGDSSGFIDFKEVTSEDYTSSTGSTFTKEAGQGTRITVLGKFQLDMYGDISTSGSQTDGLFEVMKSGFGTLLMQLFGLAVLWVAVMTAINQSKITQAVVEPIAGFGKQVGGLIQKAPQFTPIPGTGGQNIASMTTLGNRGVEYYAAEPTRKAQELITKKGLFGQGGFQEVNKVITENMGKIGNDLDIAGVDAFRKMTFSTKDFGNLYNNQLYIDQLKKMLKNSSISGFDDLKAGDRKKTTEAIDKLEAHLDNKMQFGSIFTQDRKTDTGFLDTPEDLEAILASQQSSAAKSQSEINPLAQVPKMIDKTESGTKKLQVGNYTIFVGSDNSIDKSNVADLVRHLVSENKVKSYSEENLAKWLKSNNLGASDIQRTEIIDEVKTAIRELKDSKGNNMKESDYFIDPDSEK